jgi:hypothetical protein
MVLYLSNTGIVVSNPARGMDACYLFFCRMITNDVRYSYQ